MITLKRVSAPLPGNVEGNAAGCEEGEEFGFAGVGEGEVGKEFEGKTACEPDNCFVAGGDGKVDRRGLRFVYFQLELFAPLPLGSLCFERGKNRPGAVAAKAVQKPVVEEAGEAFFVGGRPEQGKIEAPA